MCVGAQLELSLDHGTLGIAFKHPRGVSKSTVEYISVLLEEEFQAELHRLLWE